MIQADERCSIYSLDLEVVENMVVLSDIHDAIIVSTAKLFTGADGKSACIITKDKRIRGLKGFKTVW